MKDSKQIARKAILDKEFQVKGTNGFRSIANATKAFGYGSNKTVYNLIDFGLSDLSMERLNNLGYQKLVKKLQKV